MPPRTRSQLINLSGDVSIKSFADCQALLQEIATTALPEDLGVSGINLLQRDLTTTAITNTVKKHLPSLVAFVDRAAASQSSVAGIVEKAKAVLAYLGSEAYEVELAKRLISKGVFDEYIERKIAEGLAGSGLSGSSRGRTKARKTRNVALEDHVHYAVADLVFIHYRKKSYVVNSPMKTWPEPTPEPTVEVDDGEGGLRKVWRPLWNDFLAERNTEFVNEVFYKVDEDFPGAHTEEEIRGALEVFFESIVRQRRDAARGVEKANGAARRKNSRAKTLSSTMQTFFPKSILEGCRERDLLFAAFRSGAVFLSPLARNEPHGLPTTVLDDEGDWESGFDGFQLFLDWFEEKDMPEDSSKWVVRDCRWWSPIVRQGFWTLYENSRPLPGQKPRTELFHVPLAFQQELSPSTLPLLQPAAMTDSDAKKASRYRLTRGMIDNVVLETVPYQEWCVDLAEDVVMPEDRPTLTELLERPEHAALARRVRRHIDVPKDFDDEVYEKLWALRRVGRMDDYVKALRAEDAQAFLTTVDLSDLGFENDGADG